MAISKAPRRQHEMVTVASGIVVISETKSVADETLPPPHDMGKIHPDKRQPYTRGDHNQRGQDIKNNGLAEQKTGIRILLFRRFPLLRLLIAKHGTHGNEVEHDNNR